MSDSNADFHEVWWIYSPERHEWGGLRLAHFRKTIDGAVIVLIQGEYNHMRIGPRVWDDISPREGWVKVTQIPFPSEAEIEAAIEAALRGVADRITDEVFGRP